MRYRGALLAALVSSVALGLPAAPAPAAVRPAGCTTVFDLPRADCGTITVPLDRSGKVPGTVHLFFERDRVKGGDRNSTIAVFPGGPGGATSTEGESFLYDFGQRRGPHDLLLFDQRGTGRSDYLDCDVALTPTYYSPPGEDAHTLGKTVERCAKKLGVRRGFYTTRETVADLEDVRAALGIDKFILYGVSYGTRDAMAYAQAYPQHVERMILDSTVTDSGVDAFELNSVHALPRILGQLCRGGCEGITSDPAADLAALVQRLQKGPMRARDPVTLEGCRFRPAITRSRVYSMMQPLDESPELLSLLPVAISKAAHGQPYQLSVLIASQSRYFLYCAFTKILKRLIPEAQSFRDDLELLRKSFSQGNQTARLCEESQLPWSRETIVSQRQSMAERALSGYPDSAFAPLDRATVMAASLVSLCKFWVAQSPEPPFTLTALPPVPTLIVSGLDDLRTPYEDAAALAATSSQARLLRVPDVGHSAIDSSGCARRALGHFLRDEPIYDCHMYARHRPEPAAQVPSLQKAVDEILKKLPKPAR